MWCSHRLHDDDGVVDDQADGEHQAEERQCVDRESERRENHERADERHRNGEHRDERGAPALEKEEDHQHDETDRLDQRDHDLANARRDRRGRVERHIVSDARRGTWRIVPRSRALTATAVVERRSTRAVDTRR